MVQRVTSLLLEKDPRGIDASAKAIEVKNYFKNKFNWWFTGGSFDNLHYNDEVFDLVIDRAALVHTGTSVQALCAYYQFKPGGKFTLHTLC